MSEGSIFADYGLGIHDNGGLPGFNYQFDFQPDLDSDAIAVDPSLTLSPYATTTPESHFTTPPSESLLSPSSSVEFFGDHRGSFSEGETVTVAPHDTVTAKEQPIKEEFPKAEAPKKAKPSPSTTTSAPSSASTSTPPSTTSKPRTRKAASQAVEAASAPTTRSKRQKTAPAPPEAGPSETRQPQPKRKAARQPRNAKKEDVAQRSKNLERNRIAASKCRQKKKEWVHELEETKSEMEQRHNSLREEYFQLLDEVTRIKNHLMEHAACNDPNINFWIEKEALRYVERCMDPSQAKRPSMSATGSGSFALPSPTESLPSRLTSTLAKNKSINLDYMPDELLVGEGM